MKNLFIVALIATMFVACKKNDDPCHEALTTAVTLNANMPEIKSKSSGDDTNVVPVQVKGVNVFVNNKFTKEHIYDDFDDPITIKNLTIGESYTFDVKSIAKYEQLKKFGVFYKMSDNIENPAKEYSKMLNIEKTMFIEYAGNTSNKIIGDSNNEIVEVTMKPKNGRINIIIEGEEGYHIYAQVKVPNDLNSTNPEGTHDFPIDIKEACVKEADKALYFALNYDNIVSDKKIKLYVEVYRVDEHGEKLKFENHTSPIEINAENGINKTCVYEYEKEIENTANFSLKFNPITNSYLHKKLN